MEQLGNKSLALYNEWSNLGVVKGKLLNMHYIKPFALNIKTMKMISALLFRLLTISCLLLLPYVPLVAQQAELTQSQWKADLDSLELLIQTQHAKPFWKTSPAVFQQKVEAAGKAVDNNNPTDLQGNIAVLKIIAALQDGHSSMRGGDRYDRFGYLPFTAQWFGEELYIVQTTKAHQKILGHKITAIDNTPIDEALRQLRSVVPHANESRFKKFSPYYLHLPGLLYGLGISDDPNQVCLKVVNEKGKQAKATIVNQPDIEDGDMIAMTELLSSKPLYLQQNEKAYWFEYLADEKLLYLHYDRVTSMEEESIWAFTSRLFDFVEQHPVDKFVVDIRDNGGGSSAYSAGLWNGIEQHPQINQPGKLFVITGYNTFSAAISFASYLELRTHAIFVGEPVCDHLQSPGDAATYTLPHSGIRVGLSRLFHEKSFYLDERATLSPDFPVTLTFDDYKSGRDPVLAFIRDYRQESLMAMDSAYHQFAGRYAFSPFQYLDITPSNQGLGMTITGKLSSPLYPQDEATFQTEITGLTISFEGDQKAMLRYPDGKVRELPKLTNAPLMPWELIVEGKFDEAEKQLMLLKENHPDIQFWKDHSLADMAIEIYYELLATEGKTKAREAAKALLEIAIRINPEDHEYASASLRYY